MPTAHVDGDELLMQSQVTAAELRRERDNLRESNVTLAKRLGQVQDTLSRVRREKEGMKTELAQANTRLSEALEKGLAERRELEASRDQLVACVTTLEGIVDEAMEERAKRDAEHQQLHQEFLALQRQGCRCRATEEAAPRDWADEVCARDATLYAASESLRVLHTLQAAVRSIAQEADAGSTRMAEVGEAALIRARASCDEVLRVDDEVIAALQSRLLETNAALSTTQGRLGESEVMLARAEKALTRAQRHIADKSAAIAALERRVNELTERTHRGTAAASATQAEWEQLRAQLGREKALRVQERQESQRRVQQSLDMEQRLAAYVQRLEGVIRHKGVLAKAHVLHQAEMGDDGAAWHQTENEEAVFAQIGQLASTIKQAAAELQALVKRRKQWPPHTLAAATRCASRDSVGLSASPESSVSSSSSAGLSTAGVPRGPSLRTPTLH